MYGFTAKIEQIICWIAFIICMRKGFRDNPFVKWRKKANDDKQLQRLIQNISWKSSSMNRWRDTQRLWLVELPGYSFDLKNWYVLVLFSSYCLSVYRDDRLDEISVDIENSQMHMLICLIKQLWSVSVKFRLCHRLLSIPHGTEC